MENEKSNMTGAAYAELPDFEELDDDLIDLACSTGALYRVDFRRAWEVMREGLLASHGQAPAGATEPVAVVTRFHDLGGEIDWTGRTILPVGAQLYAQAAPTPRADSQPALAVDSPLTRRFGGCPSCGRSDCVAMSCTRADPADLLPIAARAPADSVTAAAAGAVAGWLPVHFNGHGFYGAPLKTEAEANQYIEQVHKWSDNVTLIARPFAWVDAAPTPADQGDARRAAILEVRALIDSNRCDGESEWARGINEARKVNLQRIDAALAQKEGR